MIRNEIIISKYNQILDFPPLYIYYNANTDYKIIKEKKYGTKIFKMSTLWKHCCCS